MIVYCMCQLSEIFGSRYNLDCHVPFMYYGIGNTRNGDDLCEAIAAAIESVPIIAFIRAYEVRFHGTTEMRVNIVKAYKPTDQPFVDKNPEIIESISSTDPSMSPRKRNPSLVPTSKSLPPVGNKEPFYHVNYTDCVPTIYLLPQNKPSTAVIKKEIISEVSEAISPLIPQTASEKLPSPSALKKTTSTIPLDRFAPVSMKSDVNPEVNDSRPSKKKQLIPIFHSSSFLNRQTFANRS